MNTNYDEAKLTAYALGECEDGERAEVERLLAGDAEARRTVDEIRALGGMLTRELSAAKPVELLPIQRAAIARATTLDHAATASRRRRRFLAIGSAIAASVALAAGVWFGTRPMRREARTIAWNAGSPGIGGSDAKRLDGATQESVALGFAKPKPAYTGTPKNPPTGVKLDPTWKPGKPQPTVMVPKDARNLALNRPVTSSDMEPIIGKLDQVTDGDKEGVEGSWVELGPGKQWVQIDLGKSADIHALVLWHLHSDPRVYKDVVVQVADDQDFIADVQTIFNNDVDNSAGLGIGQDYEYFEGYEGKVIDAKGVKGRYVRLWSRGNTSDDQNHYTDVEVHGVAAK
jgi:hypothetical protein